MFRRLCLFLNFLLLATAVLSATEEDKTRIGNKTIERTVQLRTHSLHPPYIDGELQNRWWDFGADTYVNTNKHVRLTRARPSEMGWLWSRLPLTSSNFVVEVEFKVSGESNHLFGDGFAIWLTKDRAEPGPVFGSKDNFTGLAVILDTYANSRHGYAFPRISAMLGDGQTSYNYTKDGQDQALAACSANFRRSKVGTKLKITYVKEGFLEVKIQYKAWDDWTNCFRIDNFKMPSAPYLGFSAMTGEVHDNHDIISVSTYSAIISSSGQSPHNRKSPVNSSSTSVSSFFWGTFSLLWKALLLAAVCAGGWFGWKEYQRKQRYGGFGSDSGFGGVASGGFKNMFQDAKRF